MGIKRADEKFPFDSCQYINGRFKHIRSFKIANIVNSPYSIDAKQLKSLTDRYVDCCYRCIQCENIGTYDTAGASHIGIYVGSNKMIHRGDPIQCADLSSSYW